MTKQNVKLGGFEGWRHFVFHHFHFCFVANRIVAFFDGAGAANVQAHRGVELQRIATSGGFWAAKHDANFHADLVDENDHAIGFLDVRGELAQGLTHQTGLQARQAITHLAFQFGFGCQSGHRVHHNQIHCARAHQAVHNFQGLLTRVGLADQHILQIHTQVLRVLRVQSMFSVHKRTGAAQLLHFGNDL